MADKLSWSPDYRVFLLGNLCVTIVTFTAFIGFGWFVLQPYNISIASTALLAALVSGAFTIDDVLRWRSVKYDRWWIQNGHFYYEGQEGTGVIPMTEITKARAGFGNRVIIEIASSQQIMMRYLPRTGQIAKNINVHKL